MGSRVRFEHLEIICNRMITYPECFKPFKVAGYDITLMSPVFVRVVFPVPWPESHEPTLEERAKMNKTMEWIIRYMLNQGMIMGEGVGFEVYVKNNV